MEQHDDFDNPEWSEAEIERLRKIVLTDDAAIEEVQAENARLRAELHRAHVLILEARGYVDRKYRLRADMDNYCLGVPADSADEGRK